jgi:hypothetical protein
MSVREDAVPSWISRARDHAVFLTACAFTVATACHLLDIALGGWLPYTKKVWASDVAYPSRDG